MYLIARVMLRAPETISPYGFDITRPAADQLYEWLKAKHNGFSADYSRDPSAMKWKRQCAAYIRDARTARPPLDVRHRSRLTHGDWERVFQIGDKFSGRAAERYKVECVAAAWLSFAHWSREKRQATVQPDGDVRVPLSARTRRRFPFCSNHSAEKRWTDVLQRLDSTFLLLAPGDRRDRKAAVFNVPLDSLGTGAALPLDPAHAAEILSAVKKRERLKVHHAWQVKQRFTPSEIATRYGSGARAIARFQLPRDRKDGATGALTGVRHPDTPSSGQPLATSAPPEQTNQ